MDDVAIRTLDLCSGIGALAVGIDLALGGCSSPVCYVEREAFAASVLVARMEDKALGEAPIWDDLTTFDGGQWRGLVDLVIAGFPCQRFSTATRGRARAIDLWDEVFRVVCECDPEWVFLENVQEAPIRRAADHLERVGYQSKYAPFAASEVGAPHKRVRWWLLAHDHTRTESALPVNDEMASLPETLGTMWWKEPPAGILGVDDGPAYGVDRSNTCGNAVVPFAAAYAFRELYGELTK